jgi:hypothetical protein
MVQLDSTCIHDLPLKCASAENQIYSLKQNATKKKPVKNKMTHLRTYPTVNLSAIYVSFSNENEGNYHDYDLFDACNHVLEKWGCVLDVLGYLWVDTENTHQNMVVSLTMISRWHTRGPN